MKEIFTFSNKFGSLEFYEIDKSILIKSIGIVTPSLLKKELTELSKYMKGKQNYTYVVDLRELKFPHPLNAYYLSKIYRLPNFDKYYVYSEKWYFNLMLETFKFAVPFTKFLSHKEINEIYENQTTPL